MDLALVRSINFYETLDPLQFLIFVGVIWSACAMTSLSFLIEILKVIVELWVVTRLNIATCLFMFQ